MKHIELRYDTLAECIARINKSDCLTLSDLGRKATVIIDIDEDSPFNGNFINISDYSKK